MRRMPARWRNRRKWKKGIRTSCRPSTAKWTYGRRGKVKWSTEGDPIVTIMDLTQTWVYAPLPETQADAVQLHDSLRVVMPSGATVWGNVIAKAAEGRFCHAARREQHEARHQDDSVEAAHPQPRREVCAGHDGRGLHSQSKVGEAVSASTNGVPANGNGSSRPVAIAVEHIWKRYGDFEAVKDVNFSVTEGEIFGLLGPNGAGKSTLIRMMTTLIPVTSGKALVAGHDVSKDPDDVRRMIGVIPQALTSDQDLTVEENLSIYAKLYGVPREQRKKNIEEVLEAVDLVKWRDAQTKTLSGGMRRRLEIARGLVHNPRIFFLDEPTTGLDPVSRIAVWEMLNKSEEHAQPYHAPHHALHG